MVTRHVPYVTRFRKRGVCCKSRLKNVLVAEMPFGTCVLSYRRFLSIGAGQSVLVILSNEALKKWMV
jgi:hypothetical protein